MSYCRFENTVKDLRDCLVAIDDKEISNENEKNIAEGMFAMFLEHCQEYGIIDEYNEGAIEQMIEECE